MASNRFRLVVGLLVLATVAVTVMRGLRLGQEEEEEAAVGDRTVAWAIAPRHHSCDSTLPLIHLPLSVTSRNLQTPPTRFEELPLFKFALPSLVGSVEPARFRYAVAVAADEGDPWYADTALHADMQTWWHEQWTRTWPRHAACVPALAFYAYANTRSRNTWAVNYATARGYEEGADYFYRINDDTVLYPNHWSSMFVAELAAMHPIAGLGVTGPVDPLNELLTHSFISRRHLEWYGTHFPFLFGNWWSDDWIQLVYSPPYPPSFGKDARLMSIVANVSVKHMFLKSRYEIKASQGQFEKQLAIDRKELEVFVTKNLEVKKERS